MKKRNPLVFLSLAFLLAGCSSLMVEDTVVGPDFHPGNVFLAAPKLDKSLRTVAVLPLTADPRLADGAAGIMTLEPVLRGELTKQQRFELVFVSPQQLREWTQRTSWTAGDELPPNFFEALRRHVHCDGVLFSQLTQYQAYPPLSLGWRFKLVDGVSYQVVWSADEIFDSRDHAVSNSARRYQQASQTLGNTPPDSKIILTSPDRFAHYSAAALFSTLPAR